MHPKIARREQADQMFALARFAELRSDISQYREAPRADITIVEDGGLKHPVEAT